MTETAVVEVVCGLIFRDGQLLLAQRSSSGDQPGLWEFPGGKVEAGETQPAALQRELSEELAITATTGDFIASARRQIGDKVIALSAWEVSTFCGEPRALCHQALVWCSPAEALRYPLAPLDIPLLEAWLARQPLPE